MAFRFFKFRGYHDAKKLHRKIIFLTKDLPTEFYYLKDQLRRASLSIILQIAEGSAKNSDKNFNRYIGIALGSANEVAAGLDVSFDMKLITEAEFKQTLKQCEDVTNQLGSLSKKLKAGS